MLYLSGKKVRYALLTHPTDMFSGRYCSRVLQPKNDDVFSVSVLRYYQLAQLSSRHEILASDPHRMSLVFSRASCFCLLAYARELFHLSAAHHCVQRVVDGVFSVY